MKTTREITVDGETAIVVDWGATKFLRSPNYNFIFRKTDGFFARWGRTEQDDPPFSKFGPEILDIEITTSCNGIRNKQGIEAPCKFCYKSNTRNGSNMTFETFKTILDNMPSTLCQIAFGGDARAESNPDLWRMMEYAREKGIIPNITIAEVTDTNLPLLVKYCGAVAVSRYDNADICYDAVKRLTDAGMKQVNIHQMVSLETYDNAVQTVQAYHTDPRLKKLNAIVFLSLKKKGRGEQYNQVLKQKFKELIQIALKSETPIGFDSCSAYKFLDAAREHPDFKKFQVLAEPCEATCFSSYIDVKGRYFPCSFVEDVVPGIDATSNPFLKVWGDQHTTAFRCALDDTTKKNDLKCRTCPVFEV